MNFFKPLALYLCVSASSSANAMTFSLFQDGYSSGGILTGSFTISGPPPAADGMGPPSLRTVITSLNLSFTGDAVIPDWSGDLASLAVLAGINYDFDGEIGNTLNEGFGAEFDNNFSSSSLLYQVGAANGNTPCNGVEICAILGTSSLQFTSTTKTLNVSAVPLPGTLGGLAIGLLGISLASRRKRN
jgi:hypothetical protein